MAYSVGCCYLHSGNVQVLLACVSHAIIRLHRLRRFERTAVSNLIPLQTPIGPGLSRHPRNSNVSTSHSKELSSIIHNIQQEAQLIDDIMSFCLITLKADSHIVCHAHVVPVPCSAVNSHMPCSAPALLRQCRVLRESPRGSRKYPNC
jgi:hypothetical protein